jgi:hypothetical protein
LLALLKDTGNEQAVTYVVDPVPVNS